MQIIFGNSVNLVRPRYTVLELDTFQIPNQNQTLTAWCVIEKIPLEEFGVVQNLVQLHADMMNHYQQQHWSSCLQILRQLKGRWSGEVDSFYCDLEARIEYLQQNPPDQTWTPVRLKTV